MPGKYSVRSALSTFHSGDIGEIDGVKEEGEETDTGRRSAGVLTAWPP